MYAENSDELRRILQQQRIERRISDTQNSVRRRIVAIDARGFDVLGLRDESTSPRNPWNTTYYENIQ